jgi:hypothetical protein
MTRRRHRHSALVRIYVKQDENDPLVYVITTDPEEEGAIPVIPTQKSHDLWFYALLHRQGRIERAP